MPIKIDLVAELQTALTDPDVRSVLTSYIKQAVTDALAERDTDTWLDHRAAAQHRCPQHLPLRPPKRLPPSSRGPDLTCACRW